MGPLLFLWLLMSHLVIYFYLVFSFLHLYCLLPAQFSWKFLLGKASSPGRKPWLVSFESSWGQGCSSSSDRSMGSWHHPRMDWGHHFPVSTCWLHWDFPIIRSVITSLLPFALFHKAADIMKGLSRRWSVSTHLYFGIQPTCILG